MQKPHVSYHHRPLDLLNRIPDTQDGPSLSDRQSSVDPLTCKVKDRFTVHKCVEYVFAVSRYKVIDVSKNSALETHPVIRRSLTCLVKSDLPHVCLTLCLKVVKEL